MTGLLVVPALFAQENAPGPLTPPSQIIDGFAKKEDIYLNARPQYAYRKTIRIQEFGPDGRPGGEFIATYDAARSGDGKIYEKATEAPATSLQYLQFEPEDAQFLTRIPAFPVSAATLSKYNLQYLNT